MRSCRTARRDVRGRSRPGAPLGQGRRPRRLRWQRLARAGRRRAREGRSSSRRSRRRRPRRNRNRAISRTRHGGLPRLVRQRRMYRPGAPAQRRPQRPECGDSALRLGSRGLRRFQSFSSRWSGHRLGRRGRGGNLASRSTQGRIERWPPGRLLWLAVLCFGRSYRGSICFRAANSAALVFALAVVVGKLFTISGS